MIGGWQLGYFGLGFLRVLFSGCSRICGGGACRLVAATRADLGGS
jgi:hypothetical protein